MNILLFCLGALLSPMATMLIVFLTKNWFLKQLEVVFNKKLEEFKENLLWDRKVKENAAKVAEYLAKARYLKTEDDPNAQIYISQLSWELALWLPEDIYRMATQSIQNSNLDDLYSVLINVRKLFLKDNAGDLRPEHIARHEAGIGGSTI